MTGSPATAARSKAVKVAARDGSAEDRVQAIAHLESAIERNVIDYEIADWEAIMGERFAGIANEPGYRELVRGR